MFKVFFICYLLQYFLNKILFVLMFIFYKMCVKNKNNVWRESLLKKQNYFIVFSHYHDF